jgi:hypothetical protein
MMTAEQALQLRKGSKIMWFTIRCTVERDAKAAKGAVAVLYLRVYREWKRHTVPITVQRDELPKLRFGWDEAI